jgi:hypothetical protein
MMRSALVRDIVNVLPFGGDQQPAVASFEEFDSEVFFQLDDQAADCRLGQSQQFRGVCSCATCDYRAHGHELFEFQAR